MPGNIAPLQDCFSNSSPKYGGIHFFVIPTKKAKYYNFEGWKNQIGQFLSKYRSIGPEKKVIAIFYHMPREGKYEPVSLSGPGWQVRSHLINPRSYQVG